MATTQEAAALDWQVDRQQQPAAAAVSTPHPQDARFSCNICFDSVNEPVVTQCGHLYCWPCLYQWLEPGMIPSERLNLTGISRSSGLGLDDSSNHHDASRRRCPVCKAPCSVKKIVPIYVRTENYSNTNLPSSSVAGANGGGGESSNEGESVPAEVLMPLSNDNHNSHETEESAVPSNTTGLRLRFRSVDSEIPSDGPIVPRRPAANSPVQDVQLSSSSSSSPSRTTSNALHHPHSPQPPTGPHPASLSRGMLPLVQHALRRAGAGSTFVPPLERLEGIQEMEDLGATDFLSRLLLMLGSFVILCLLLF